MVMGGHSSVYAGYCVGCTCWVHDSTVGVGKPTPMATGSINSIPSPTSFVEAPIRSMEEITILPATTVDANIADEKEVISNRTHPTLPLTTSEDDAHHEQIMILLSSDQPHSYEN